MKTTNTGTLDLFGSVNIRNWYRKWWIWLIIALIAVCVAVGIFSNHGSFNTNRAFTRTYKLDQTVNDNGLKLRVNRVHFSNGDTYTRPGHGKVFLIANVSIINDTRKPKKYNEFDFDLNTNGVTHGFDSYMDNGKHELYSGSLDPNAKVTGNLFGKVKDVSRNQLRWHPHFSQRAIKVNLNK